MEKGMKEMSDEELLIFMKTQLENGVSMEDALKEAKLVDDLLTLKKAHVLGSNLKRARYNGGRRPNKEMQRLSNLLEARIDSFIKNEQK